MKRLLTTIGILPLLFLFLGWNAAGQKLLPKEKIFLFTDRTLYAVNEDILIKMEYLAENVIRNNPWSTVVYVELIRQDGYSLVQHKFHLSETGGSGIITIPEEIPSGVYFLKAYTKWMRNFPPDFYEYKPIKIINPFTETTDSLRVQAGTPAKGKFVPQRCDTTFLNCSADKKKYRPREKVTLSISTKEGVDFKRTLSVSVCKSGLNNFEKAWSIPDSTFILSPKNMEYFPEPRGISISGRIVNKETAEPIPSVPVQLALLNGNSFYSGNFSNLKGQFLFTIPHHEGPNDFFMEAGTGNQPVSIQIDQEFCKKKFSPSIIPPELTVEEQDRIREIGVNMQINKLTSPTLPLNDLQTKNFSASFYGEPTKIIFPRKYIDLPHLSEFIFELVPEFITENHNNQIFLRLSKSNSLSAFPALCLVNNVPVSDMKSFLEIPTEKIDRIELVDKPYITGNTEHNGIFQVFSKKRDMAGIDLPKNSLFFNFTLYTGIKPVDFPDYGNKSNNIRKPDRRNTLYWNPSVHLVPGVVQELHFYTNELKGDYEISIQGLTETGDKIELGKTFFSVD
jgi:hypothetical protein